ncbi:DUF1211 domain-containing protein [Glaciecola sp. XM2]|uniref:TMEM175 family protein n=1 Tax=Glaciecola sp. XM2 TaxID=1914931 RepID=UPI001BDF1250|nr:TMEM175 family protein [Glaciecola sp. XM2]MBT1450912.1 DUF1211 domain-containing protein [Glaciecola sp. XM2]
MTRIETFVDAAFAFAVTLLVIGGGDNIPNNYQDFVNALQQVPSFTMCFANIVFFWYAHHIWSRRFGLDDGLSTFLSLLLILVVLIFVYPLKAIYAGAFNFIPDFDSGAVFALSSVEDFSGLLVIFGLAFSMLSAIICALNWHALRLADEIGLTMLEKFDTKTTALLWLVNASVPLGSVAIALSTTGVFWTKAASFFYIVFAVVLPILKITRMRLRRKISTQEENESQ